MNSKDHKVKRTLGVGLKMKSIKGGQKDFLRSIFRLYPISIYVYIIYKYINIYIIYVCIYIYIYIYMYACMHIFLTKCICNWPTLNK